MSNGFRIHKNPNMVYTRRTVLAPSASAPDAPPLNGAPQPTTSTGVVGKFVPLIGPARTVESVVHGAMRNVTSIRCNESYM
jgi:hypothetical protein